VIVSDLVSPPITRSQPNILVDNSDHARITDFGLTKITKHPHSAESVSHRHGLRLQRSAPEVLREGVYSKEADIFSFGIVMYEVCRQSICCYACTSSHYRCLIIQVLTGAVPFIGKRPAAAAIEIMNGQRPPRPTHLIFSEESWSLLERCWAQDPRLRPEILEVLETLLGL
jgi:serine/threonine protein kinase